MDTVTVQMRLMINHPIKKRNFPIRQEHATVHQVLYATAEPEVSNKGSGKTASLATGLVDGAKSNAGRRGNVDETASLIPSEECQLEKD
jgi:hypothetical protein